MFNTDGEIVEHTFNGEQLALDRPVRSSVEVLEWPPWAQALKMFATPEDKGIGDVVARTIGEEKSEAFKAFYKKVTGKDCGCSGRQAKWNAMYPLQTNATGI